MSKKGFTLIEVMATVLIIATISLISYPMLTNVLKNNEKIEDETFNENVILAAKSYFNINKEKEDDKNYKAVGLKKLVDEKYIDQIPKERLKDSVFCDGSVCRYHKFVENYSNDCVKTTCELEEIKKGISVDVLVNETNQYKFYVIADDGENLILQMYRNIVLEGNEKAVYWYYENNNTTKGPITSLEYLAKYTSRWNNIDLLNYIYENPHYVQNDGYGYKMLNITNGKAITVSNDGESINNIVGEFRSRMITFEEIKAMGCSTGNVAGTCPYWMVDYLYGSLEKYPNNNNSNDYAQYYWSLTTRKSGSTANMVSGTGASYYIYLFKQPIGVRPVIEINKKNIY